MHKKSEDFDEAGDLDKRTVQYLKKNQMLCREQSAPVTHENMAAMLKMK